MVGKGLHTYIQEDFFLPIWPLNQAVTSWIRLTAIRFTRSDLSNSLSMAAQHVFLQLSQTVSSKTHDATLVMKLGIFVDNNMWGGWKHNKTFR